jgi:AcrR family transcriptional regulator
MTEGGDVMGQRKQLADHTRTALIEAAKQLFGEYGYADTSIDEVVAAARVTKGAMYHHFENKRDLFREVVAAVNQDVYERLYQQALTDPVEGDLWDMVRVGFQRYLDAFAGPEVRQILHTDGLAVLGPDLWAKVDRRHIFAAEWMSAATQEGLIDEVSPDVLAYLCVAMLEAAARRIAGAQDQAEADKATRATIDRILQGLRRSPH